MDVKQEKQTYEMINQVMYPGWFKDPALRFRYGVYWLLSLVTGRVFQNFSYSSKPPVDCFVYPAPDMRLFWFYDNKPFVPKLSRLKWCVVVSFHVWLLFLFVSHGGFLVHSFVSGIVFVCAYLLVAVVCVSFFSVVYSPVFYAHDGPAFHALMFLRESNVSSPSVACEVLRMVNASFNNKLVELAVEVVSPLLDLSTKNSRKVVRNLSYSYPGLAAKVVKVNVSAGGICWSEWAKLVDVVLDGRIVAGLVWDVPEFTQCLVRSTYDKFWVSELQKLSEGVDDVGLMVFVSWLSDLAYNHVSVADLRHAALASTAV